jgi:hypothetical protein
MGRLLLEWVRRIIAVSQLRPIAEDRYMRRIDSTHRQGSAPDIKSALLAVCLLAFCLLVGLGCGGNTHKQIQQLESKLNAELPVGSSSAEIIDYLDSQELKHYGVWDASDFGRLDLPEVSSNTKVLKGYIPSTGADGLFNVENIGIYFHLDADLRLERIYIQEELTGF